MCFLLPWKSTGIARFFFDKFPQRLNWISVGCFYSNIVSTKREGEKRGGGGIEFFLQNKWVFGPTSFKKQFLVPTILIYDCNLALE